MWSTSTLAPWSLNSYGREASLVSRKRLNTQSVIPALPRKGNPAIASLGSGLRRKDDSGNGMSHNFADVKPFVRQYTGPGIALTSALASVADAAYSDGHGLPSKKRRRRAW